MNSLAIIPDELHDFAHIGCEELPYLFGDFSGPRPTDVADALDRIEERGAYAPAEDNDPRFAGMNEKEVANCKAWLRWADKVTFLNGIHNEVEVAGKLPPSALCA